MFSNTEFNHLKLKLDQLYLSLSGGKVNGETVFSKKVTFGSGDKVIKIYDGKIEGLDSPEGHTYDLEPSSDKSELLLKEDGTLKDTIPVNTNFVGTRARWNTLTAVEKAKYLTMDFLGDEGNGDISDKAITYTSSDVADGNANAWTVVTPISTGLSLNTLFSRVSQMFKNVRYLYKSAPPIGTINAFGGTTAPDGWLLCQGQAISRTEYSKLFSVIGTNFGAGNGSTTFNVPDLRGEFLRGAGTNSHANQGNGGSVGTHQDATSHVNIKTYATSNDQWFSFANGLNEVNNVDKEDSAVTRYIYGQSVSKYNYNTMATHYTSRPTNTSVNYIIRAK